MQNKNTCEQPKDQTLNEFVDRLVRMRGKDSYNAMMRIMDISKLHHEITRRESEMDGIPQSYRTLLFHLSNLTGNRPGCRDNGEADVKPSERSVTQLELVHAAHLKPPTVSVTLANMEKDGYISRKTGENDRRQSRVFLTEKGMGVNQRIHDSFVHCDETALAGLTDEETRTLCALLDRVIDNMIAERLSGEDSTSRASDDGK